MNVPTRMKVVACITLVGLFTIGGGTAAIADSPDTPSTTTTAPPGVPDPTSSATPTPTPTEGSNPAPSIGDAMVFQSLNLPGSRIRIDGSNLSIVETITVDGTTLTRPFLTPGWTVSETDSTILISMPRHVTGQIPITLSSAAGDLSVTATYAPDPPLDLSGFVEVPATNGATAYFGNCVGQSPPGRSIDDTAIPTAAACQMWLRFPNDATSGQTFLAPFAGMVSSEAMPATTSGLPYVASLFPGCEPGVQNGTLVGISSSVPTGLQFTYAPDHAQRYPNGTFASATVSFYAAYCRGSDAATTNPVTSPATPGAPTPPVQQIDPVPASSAQTGDQPPTAPGWLALVLGLLGAATLLIARMRTHA